MDGYDRALLLTYLQQVPTFGACSEPELEDLLARAELRAVEAGTEIVHEGDVGDEFFLVAQGEVDVLRRGREVARLGPGGFFGELALFDEAPRNASVIAETAVAFACSTARTSASSSTRSPRCGTPSSVGWRAASTISTPKPEVSGAGTRVRDHRTHVRTW
jgi:hypothetical protein